IDALFGALGERDIGSHFPDKDPRYKGADSRRLLVETMKCVGQRGFEVVNIDTTVIMEEPKIGPYVDEIKSSLSPLLGIPQERVSVKAKTNEKIGEVGENRASQAYAVVLLRSKL
ncbi:MAG TPA: 2-C-methyl-D-erythritol 2,4-cyclodiphosphate synthase, partial [Candidatus Aminicenantes bacterium]|nr:2-C-methyl-D-erythritol 2,4-cyclodiphosphate synthase [Candidatus Aminicenantes bacterium]